MDQGTKDRLAKNEALFRDVNERVREIDERQAVATGTDAFWDFLCECGHGDCTQAMSLTLEEYERTRSSPVHFAVIPGHERPEVERVLERTDRFLLVEKLPEEQPIARVSDPRS
ncbi:MAG: hypothetical protein M3377_00210 [Actinomycetota bacterium]|nr:hypothetical protein [Actinomycetota bacterium]